MQGFIFPDALFCSSGSVKKVSRSFSERSHSGFKAETAIVLPVSAVLVHKTLQMSNANKRLRNWCWTAYVDPMEHYQELEDHRMHRYTVWQEETCPHTGTLHYQGYSEFNCAVKQDFIKQLFRNNSMHLEVRKGTRAEARGYCMRASKRVPGTEPIEIGEWTGPEERARTDLRQARVAITASNSWREVLNNEEIAPVVARYRTWAREIYENREITVEPPEITLWPWEEEVLEIIDGDPVKRLVIWIWSEESGTGKTTFYDYCCHHYNVLPANDYINTLYAYDSHSIIWFDLTRDESYLRTPYHAIEKFSNGGFHLSTKYVSVKKFVNAHVVVTANFQCNEQRLPGRCRFIQAKKPAPAQPSPDLLVDEPSEDLGYIDTLGENEDY